MSESQAPKFHDRRGFCTLYAHHCGYVDSAEKNGDKQFITMGFDSACYFVKVRGDNPSWEVFDNDGTNAAGEFRGTGREAARRHFMKMIRQTGAVRQIGRPQK